MSPAQQLILIQSHMIKNFQPEFFLRPYVSLYMESYAPLHFPVD